ncbi:Hypothetical protein A7982_10310 [Minicystis rosea]|nr:Hypothetical protein A7982_10310 [Minicystis rosea]
MVLTWFVGVHGLSTGCANAMFLREGRLPDITAAAHAARSSLDMMDFAALVRAAELSAMLSHVKLTFPFAVAEAMLGGLLVIASGLAMSGRRGARSLALQAVLANALLAVGAYVLTRGVRADWIDVVMNTVAAMPATAPQKLAFGDPSKLWWITRIKLFFFDLSPLLLAALALTRARTKSFFDAVAHATESAGEP